MNQTKIYAIFITAVLILWWPAWYFFTTKDMTLEIQQKDEKIAKALDTLQKAKSSIENKDKTISENEEYEPIHIKHEQAQILGVTLGVIKGIGS